MVCHQLHDIGFSMIYFWQVHFLGDGYISLLEFGNGICRDPENLCVWMSFVEPITMLDRNFGLSASMLVCCKW
jgi:hypothetical protein